MDYIPDESAIQTDSIEVRVCVGKGGGLADLWAGAFWRAHAWHLIAVIRKGVHREPRCVWGLGLDSQVDKDTLEMLRSMNMANLPGVSVVQPQVRYLSSCSAQWRRLVCHPERTALMEVWTWAMLHRQGWRAGAGAVAATSVSAR